MRKLKLQVQITVDGYIGGPNGEMDWMTVPWTDDINQYVARIVDPIDTIVLGRKLAEGFIPYWASVAADPNNPEIDGGRIFTNTPKVVFTRTLDKSPWANTVLAKGDVVSEVTRLKNQSGKDIYACGGATFVSSLIKHGLVDDYHLFVNPAVIGSGLSIFSELDSKRNLKLVSSTPFDCGIVAFHYEK